MSDVDGRPTRFEEEVLRSARSAIVVCRADRVVTYASPHAVRLFGCELLGQDISALVAPATADALISYLARLAAEDPRVVAYCETRVVRDGERAVEVVGVNRLSDATIGGIVLSLSDVTEHRHRAATLERSATTDSLTGLPNRVVLLDRLREMLRSGHPGSVVLLDLNRFKEINDRYGHQLGDAVLIEIGRRVHGVVETTGGTVARIGGDEFVVLLPETTTEAAEALTEAIHEALAQPHRIGATDVTVAFSAGIAPLMGTVERTLRAADVAMYASKEAGSPMRVYTPDLTAERRAAAQELEALRRRNEELLGEARTDPLTNLPNRRRYDEDFAAVDRATANGLASFSVIVIDIDHFGRFNRSEGGQESGDETLRRAAQAFSEAVREGDVVYRRGGEEFVVLLPDADLENACGVADRISATLRRHRIPHPDQAVVTASLGVASFDPAVHECSGAVVDAADGAMRRAKAGGRDRIVVARP